MNQNPDMTITKGQKRVQKQQETMKLRGKQKDGENYDMQLKPLKSTGVVENDLKISEYKRRS